MPIPPTVSAAKERQKVPGPSGLTSNRLTLTGENPKCQSLLGGLEAQLPPREVHQRHSSKTTSGLRVAFQDISPPRHWVRECGAGHAAGEGR